MSTEIEKNEQKEMEADPSEQVKLLSTGVLPLKTPIQKNDKEYEKLKYDFSMITGWDYADAMDSDPRANNTFRISAKQALSLFALAVVRHSPEIPANAVKEQLSMEDSMNAIRLATSFFIASTRAASKRFMKESQTRQ